MENQLRISLANSKLLKNVELSDINLEQISGKLHTIHEGEIIYREGKPSDSIYLVVTGEVNLLKKKLLGKTKSIIFYENDFFGYEEFLEGTSRTSTAVALRDSYIIELKKVEVDFLTSQNSQIMENMKNPNLEEEKVPEVETEVNTEENESVINEDFVSDDFDLKLEDFELDNEPFPSDILEDQTNIESELSENLANNFPEAEKFEKPFVAENKIETDLELNTAEELASEEDAFAETLKENENDDVFFNIEDEAQKSNEVNENELANNIDMQLAEDSGTSDLESFLLSPDPEPTEEKPTENLDLNSYHQAGAYQAPTEDIVSENLNEETNTIENVTEKNLNENNIENIVEEDTNEEKKSELNDMESFYQNLENESQNIIDGNLDSDTINMIDNMIESSDDDDLEETKRILEELNNLPPGLMDDDGIPKPEGEITDEDIIEEETISDSNEFEIPNSEPTVDESLIDNVENENVEEEVLSNFEEPLITDEDNSMLELEKELEILNQNSAEKLTSTEDKIIEKDINQTKPDIIEKPLEKEALTEGTMNADQLSMINKAAQLVNSKINLDDVLTNIVDVGTNLTNADRGTLYLVDKENNELWSKVAMGNELKQIRLNIGEGIAGWVAQSGEIVNIEDVKQDSRFKSDYDKSSGYQTQTMLCFPIKNKEEEVVGVLQLLNSKNDRFSALDESFLSALSIHAALALENANLVEKLLQTERVSSLGKMANFLIQDIKKPVLVSKRYAEHLKSKEFPEEILQVLDMLLDQLNHVADIVQTTSSYSQGTSVLRKVKTSLNELLDDYSERVDGLLTSRSCMIDKAYDDDVKVNVDIKEFNQCYTHIVKNACDAMPDGGSIRITTIIEGDNVKISFKDYGLGIPDTMKDKIFEPFMSHGKKEGTGLGLSITKKIIEDHGGKIEVHSELGDGANFTVSLPKASEF